MSSERSGSNLLRSMLDAHPDIAAPPAVHFTTGLAPLAPLYGDLSRRENMLHLLRDAVEITQAHFYPWAVRLDPEAVLDTVERPTFWGAIDGLFRAYSERQGKSAWVSKDNSLFEHAIEMYLDIPGLFVIYLVRDGRDYACSFRDAPAGPKHVYTAARLWREEQRKSLRVESRLRREGRTIRIRYEDLVQDPEQELNRLCRLVALPFHQEMLEYHQRRESQEMAEKSTFWSNLSTPVTSSSMGRYRSQLGAGAIRLFEGIAGAELRLLGYEPETDPLPERVVGRWQHFYYSALDRVLRYAKRLRVSERKDRAHKDAVLRKIQRQLLNRQVEFPDGSNGRDRQGGKYA